MKRKLPLVISVLAILAIVGYSIRRINMGDTFAQHSLIDGTREMLQNDTIDIELNKLAVNFYIENSASMDGYVTGTTEFKDVLGKMIVSAHHHFKTADLFLVNNEIYSVGDNAINFIQMLSPARIKVGNVGNTDVNQIFRNILSKTNKDTISVLFSDCIYSVKNVKDELDNAKNATTDAFAQRLRVIPTLATIILQFESDFSGVYYDRNDSPYQYQGKRPFYVVMTGDRSALKVMFDKFKISEYSALKNKYFLSAESWTVDENNACCIISDYTTARRIKANRKNNLDIESIDLDRYSDKLTFAIGIDAANLFVDENCLLDSTNYAVEPSNYKVSKIHKVTAAVANDFSQKYQESVCNRNTGAQ